MSLLWVEAVKVAQQEGHAEDRVLYHGTCTDRPLEEITPLSQRGRRSRVSDSDPDYAYATSDPDDAWHWAEEAWHKASTGIPRVFRVRSRGPVETDPNFSHHDNPAQVRSRHGFDVLGEEPMPHDLRDLYLDDED